MCVTHGRYLRVFFIKRLPLDPWYTGRLFDYGFEFVQKIDHQKWYLVNRHIFCESINVYSVGQFVFCLYIFPLKVARTYQMWGPKSQLSLSPLCNQLYRISSRMIRSIVFYAKIWPAALCTRCNADRMRITELLIQVWSCTFCLLGILSWDPSVWMRVTELKSLTFVV
jgi:hypothetical protein